MSVLSGGSHAVGTKLKPLRGFVKAVTESLVGGVIVRSDVEMGSSGLCLVVVSGRRGIEPATLFDPVGEVRPVLCWALGPVT